MRVRGASEAVGVLKILEVAMRRLHLLVVVMLMAGGTAVVWGRELGHRVHLKDGANVVERGGEKLDFKMSAEQGRDGNIVVKMVIPQGSNVADASYLRLEIMKDGKVLVWTRLASHKGDDGSITAGFQIHESLVKDAHVGISYDADRVKGRVMEAYLVPVAEYITDRLGK